MIRKILLPLFVCLSLTSCKVQAQEPATLYIEVQSEVEGEQGLGKCSATAISRKALLTARHCLLGSSIAKLNINSRSVSVKSIEADGSDHLLIVLAEDHFTKWSRLGVHPGVGKPVTIVGNPGPLRAMFRRGYVSGVDNLWEDFSGHGIDDSKAKGAMLYDLNGFNGDSGSGVFNEKGQLVAVLSYVRAYALPGAFVKFAGSLPLSFTKEQWRTAGVYK